MSMLSTFMAALLEGQTDGLLHFHRNSFAFQSESQWPSFSVCSVALGDGADRAFTMRLSASQTSNPQETNQQSDAQQTK